MNALGKALIVAAAVVAVALTCIGCGPSANGVARLQQTPTAHPDGHHERQRPPRRRQPPPRRG